MSEAAQPAAAPDAPSTPSTEAAPLGASAPEAPAAPAEPTATPAPTPSALESFLGSADESVRSDPIWKQYEERGTAGIAKDFLEAQRLVGSQDRVSRPKPDAPPEDWDKFYNTLGRPESPDQYDLGDFTPPEGLPWSESQQRELTQRMHKLGLTNEQMSGAIRDLADVQAADFNEAMRVAQEYKENAERELQQEWGVAFEAKKELAEKAWVHAFGEEARSIGSVEIPGFGRFGAIPSVVKAFAKIGESLREDVFVSSDTSPGHTPMTKVAALERIEQMNTDPEKGRILSDSSDPEHKALTRERDRLYKLAYPD
jgi:hypothetical protein